MQRLRVIVTSLVIFGVILVFGFPVALMNRPSPKASLHDREVFALTITAYFVVMIIVFCLIMWMAWKLWRKQAEDLAEKQMENMRDLIEGTLSDHADKKPDQS